MLVFRMISFGIRIATTFLVVFLLQIQFDGKSLETYIVQWGNRFVGTQVLDQSSQDVSKTLRSLNSAEKKNEMTRRLSQEILPVIENLQERITLPDKDKDN